MTSFFTSGFTVLQWANLLLWFLDFVALVSLTATGEVRPEIFCLLLILLGIRLFIFKTIKERFIFVTLVVIAITAILVGYRLKLHPVLIVANALPIFHSILWFVPGTTVYRGWRVGIGFFELALSSALTPDLYLAFAIFLFVTVAAFAVSCNFLDYELRKNAPEVGNPLLPNSFFTRSVRVSFLIFLTSGLIFPLLPRMKVSGPLDNTQFQGGYSEEVTLLDNKKTLLGDTSRKAALWLFMQKGDNFERDFYLGLLRGRVLESFDGSHWTHFPGGSPNNSGLVPKPLGQTRQYVRAHEVTAIRELSDTQTLPVPYGTKMVWRTGDLTGKTLKSTAAGEWIEPFFTQKQVTYSYEFLRSAKDSQIGFLWDPPRPTHLKIPPILMTDRMNRLSHKIFSIAKDDLDKIALVASFFKKERFKGSLDLYPASSETEEDAQLLTLKKSLNWHPLEKFLLLSKQGDCEWFSSATAILLRMAGVPTRLVSGFRITEPATGNIITIRNQDAHAWVEAWTEQRGWIPLDFTPQLKASPSMIALFHRGYDILDALWNRYVLAYASDTQEKSHLMSSISFFQNLSSNLNGNDKGLKEFLFDSFIRVGLALLLFALLSELAFHSISKEGGFQLKRREKKDFRTSSLEQQLGEAQRLLEELFPKGLTLAMRSNASTFEDWIVVLEAVFGGSAGLAARDWYTSYLSSRFGTRNQELNQDLKDLNSKLIRFREQMRQYS